MESLFCTKGNVQEVLRKQKRTASALLVPNGDPSAFKHLVLPPVIQGPFEIVAQDQTASTMHKRQVLLIQLFEQVRYSPPQPTYAATLAEVAELVLELDTRIMTKETVQMAGNKTHNLYKQTFRNASRSKH